MTNPSDWIFSGYNEIQNPNRRYGIIDHKKLVELLNAGTEDKLKEQHIGWIEEALRTNNNQREARWTESIAVGSREFVNRTWDKLGLGGQRRKIVVEREGACKIQEPSTPYGIHFTPEKMPHRPENTYLWEHSNN